MSKNYSGRLQGIGPATSGPGSAQRAAVYARYSSDNQDESSIGQQVNECRRKAKKEGVEIPDRLVFKDEARSGADPNRPGFDLMLQAARDNEFEFLYVENLSRFTRDLAFWASAQSELESLGISIISVSEGFDSRRPGASMEGNFRALVNEEQRKTIASNVRRGQRDAVERGYSCGDCCFGYRSEPIPGTEYGRSGTQVKVRKRVVFDDMQAAIVRETFDRFVNHAWPIANIVRDLNARSIPKGRRAVSSTWRHDDLLRMLRNEKYVGVWTFGQSKRVRDHQTGKVIQIRRPVGDDGRISKNHPDRRIIDQETFDRAQELLDESSKRYTSHRKRNGRLGGSMRGSAHPLHLLQGLLYCGRCGSLCYRAGQRYMACSGVALGHCSQRTRIDRQLAKELVLQEVGRVLASNAVWREEVIDVAFREIHAALETCPQQRTELAKAKSILESKINNLVSQCEEAEKGTAERLHKRLEERNRELREIERRLTSLDRAKERVARLPDRAELEARLTDLPSLFLKEDSEAALALRRLIGRVVVHEESSTKSRGRPLTLHFSIDGVAAVKSAIPELREFADVPSTRLEVVVSLRRPTLRERIADEAKRLYDTGEKIAAIADRLGCTRSQVKRALDHWNSSRGLPQIDYRHERKRLPSKSLSVRISDRAKELWDQGLMMRDIAEQLGCDRGIATHAIQHWFKSRGLPVPNNQARRKALGLGRAKNGHK